MKIIISYPPLDSSKGTPLLSQNRQFQYFISKTVIFPVVPAQAATLLKESGHKVIWNDSIAESLSYDKYIEFLSRESPDMLVFETKTPVVKEHWKIINDIKANTRIENKPIIVLFGDHVTALPEESMNNSSVDFVITGGDYDFLLKNLCECIEASHKKGEIKEEYLEPGIWYRKDGALKNSGSFVLDHDLNSLPFIDRDIVDWKLYAYDNGNYKRTPGTYIMSGRDCWWGKCSFCLHADTHILTSKGQILIEELFENACDKGNLSALTHNATFEPITKLFKRHYEGTILNLEFYGLKENLKITPNHKIYTIKRSSIRRCSRRCSWDYLCVPGRKSSRIDCISCKRKYFENYALGFVAAGELEEGDFAAVPIIRLNKDLDCLDLLNIYKEQPHFVATTKLKEESLINKILVKHNAGLSQRKIAKDLKIDRETVKRYLFLSENNELILKENPIVMKDNYIKFEKGKKWINRKVPLSKEFMRFIGYYLAEGHVSQHKSRPNSYALVLTFSQKEKEFIDDVLKIAKEVFDRLDIRMHSNKKNKTVQIELNSSILAKVIYGLFGSNSYNKKIPELFLYLDLEKQKELLKGLFRGDGHLRARSMGKGGTEYVFETVSSLMANQVLMLLFRNNAIPRFRVCSSKKKDTSLKYSISLSQYDIEELFPDIVMPKRRTNYRRGFILGDYALIPIKRIYKEKYSGYVYNLEVERHHSYLANNIAVSNCSWPTLYPKFRARTVGNVLDEIGSLIERYHVKEIMDDTGTFPIGDWLKQFCNGMIERGYNKKVYIDCNMRFGALSLDEYKLMKKAGFRLLLFGLESANQKTLDRINKNLNVDEIIGSCKMAREAGLYPHITIMYGYPWESFEDAQKTLELGRWLLKRDYAYTMQATIVIPYPGSRLFEECKRNDWLKTSDWSRYDMKEPIMKLSFDESRVLGLVKDMYSVSFHPEFIFRRILSVREFDDLRYFGRAARKVVGHIFDFIPKK